MDVAPNFLGSSQAHKTKKQAVLENIIVRTIPQSQGSVPAKSYLDSIIFKKVG
jgi:hypothetical protein